MRGHSPVVYPSISSYLRSVSPSPPPVVGCSAQVPNLRNQSSASSTYALFRPTPSPARPEQRLHQGHRIHDSSFDTQDTDTHLNGEVGHFFF